MLNHPKCLIGNVNDGSTTVSLGGLIDIESIAGDLYKFCDIEGVHLGVILDPFNDVHETDEDDNVATIPVTVTDCAGMYPRGKRGRIKTSV